jgi:hypothetical protein
MPNVVRMKSYKNRELVETLRELLALAEADEMDAHCFVVKIGNTHRAGVTGIYKTDAGQALQATLKLERFLEGPLALLPVRDVMRFEESTL